MEITRTKFSSLIKDNPTNALKEIAEFFAGFKKQPAKKTTRVDEDQYYTSIHKLDRLIDSEGKPTTLYLYDKQQYCRGCSYNCNRMNNQLELRDMSDRAAINKFFDICVGMPHELTRNLGVGLAVGGELLEVRTWYEDYPKSNGTTRIQASDGYYIHQTRPDYKKTLELINLIRTK